MIGSRSLTDSCISWGKPTRSHSPSEPPTWFKFGQLFFNFGFVRLLLYDAGFNMRNGNLHIRGSVLLFCYILVKNESSLLIRSWRMLVSSSLLWSPSQCIEALQQLSTWTSRDVGTLWQVTLVAWISWQGLWMVFVGPWHWAEWKRTSSHVSKLCYSETLPSDSSPTHWRGWSIELLA